MENANKLRLIRFRKFSRRSLKKGAVSSADILLTLSLATLLLGTFNIISSSAAPTPTNVRVIMSTAGDNALTVSWSQPSGPVTGYWLSRSGQIIRISTTATNVNYVDSGLLSGQNYVYKVASSDAASVSRWSLKVSGITKTAGSYTKPHAPFTDNTNMCQACHSIHTAPTAFKTLYNRYSNLSSAYSTTLSQTGQSLPGADICFNCHDGSGAGYNVKQYYDQASSSNVPWPGHMTRRAGTTASEASFGGWKYINALPANSRLPCMVCHDSHVSSKNNWKMLADGLVDYAKSPSGGWSSGTNILSDGITYNVVDTANNAWEKCTVCHHDGSRTNGIMRVAGLDLYWPSSNNGTPGGEQDVTNHGTQTNCSCHAGDPNSQNNVHALGKGGKPNSPVDDCSSCHVDVVNRTMDSSMTSRHFITAASGNSDPASNPDRCTSKCHNNHGQRTPTDSHNLYTNAISRSGAANYDFTMSASQPGLCLSCHQSTTSSNRPGGTSNSTAYVSAIPPQSFIDSSHSYPSTSYKTKDGKRSYVMTCLKCHRDNDQTTDFAKWGPHASANRSLLYLPATQLGGNAGDEERTCLSCHSANADQWAGRAMATAAWKISQAFSQQSNWGHARDLLSPAIDRHRASEGYTAAWQTGWMPSTARHVECFDCHNPHYASQSYNYNASLPYTGSVNELEQPGNNLISKTLRGVWGVYPTTNWSSIPTAANYGTTYTSATPVGRLFYTGSATKQYMICLKCHSAYAYGTRATDRPRIPSGVPSANHAGTVEGGIGVGSQTDILAEFNPNNIGYHPILAPGKNQPAHALNSANWAGPMAPNSVSYGTQTNVGLTASFVPPWGASSLVTCSDCHSHSSSSYSRGYYTSAASTNAGVNAWDGPRGPHGGSRRWMLRTRDTSINYRYNNGTVFRYSLLSSSFRNFCVNCHRADVYSHSAAGAIVADGVASNLSRVDHDPTDNSNSWGENRTVWGIFCMNCHGGGLGNIHGTGGAAGAQATSNPMGRRLIYGSAWVSYQVNSGVGVSCQTPGAANSITNCTQHNGGYTNNNDATEVNYNYTGTP